MFDTQFRDNIPNSDPGIRVFRAKPDVQHVQRLTPGFRPSEPDPELGPLQVISLVNVRYVTDKW